MHFIKYIPFVLVGVAAIMAVYYIFTKDYVWKWFLQTLQESGKPSGKALAAFGCINSIIVGFFVSMYYAEGHVPPEWYVWLMAGLATSFYGIREVGRFITTKFGAPLPTDPEAVADQSTQPASKQPPQSKKADPTVINNNNQQVVPDEIG